MIPSLTEFICITHKEEEEQLGFVCLSAQCVDCGLLCRLCSIGNHLGHKVISFKKLIAKMVSHQFDQSSKQTAERYHQNNKRFLIQAIEKIRNAKQRIIRGFDELEELANKSYSDSIRAVPTSKSPQSFEQFQLGASDSVSSANKKIRKIVQMVLENERIAMLYKGDYGERVRANQEILESKLKRLSYTFERECQVMIPLFSGQFSKQVLKFSNVDKHSDITVDEEVATRTKQSLGFWDKYGGVCVTVELESWNAQQCIGLKILSCKNWITVGIALQSVLRLKKFSQFKWQGKAGHGHYMIESTGQTYWHSDQNDNNQANIQFTKDDVVGVSFDHNQMLLIFSTKQGARTIKVARPQKGDCYRFVIYVRGIGDAVKLLQGNQAQ